MLPCCLSSYYKKANFAILNDLHLERIGIRGLN
jgi:hypothetical protein